MRRWAPLALVLVLLAGCGHAPPPVVAPMVYDVAYAVVVGPGDLGGYKVTYTDDNNEEQSAVVPPGKAWAHHSRITSSASAEVMLAVQLQPVAYLHGLPQIQCRFDVNQVMVGLETGTKGTCRAYAFDVDIRQKLRSGTGNRAPRSDSAVG